MNGIVAILGDYRETLSPKENINWEEFDQLISPMINNPLPLFNFLKEGHNINFLETIISLVIFTKNAEYDDRIQLIFSVFDDDGGGSLDRKEATKLVQSTIYGLAKLAGLTLPAKTVVQDYIHDLF